MGNVWTDLGFTDNPYDYRALSVTDEDRKMLVGRKTELASLKTLVETGRGIIIVEGGVGVGKTSIVNAMQYDLLQNAKEKILPSFQKIELTSSNIEPKNFVLSAFSNMIYSLEKLTKSDLSKEGGVLKEGKQLVAQTVQSDLSGNLQFFGFGGGLGKSASSTQPATITLQTILNTLDKWTDYVAKHTDYGAIITIPIDNMDILEDDDIVSFLNTMRDTLVERNRIVWIFIGRRGLFSLLASRARRVSELVTGQPVILEPLPLSDVYDAINVRLRLLSKDGKPKDPLVSDEIVKLLYDTSNGEIRYVFKRITDIILRFRTKFPSVSKVPLEVAKAMIREFSNARIAELNLSEKENELIKFIVNQGSIRTRDFKEVGLRSPQALNRYLGTLLTKGLVSKDYGEGTAVYYKPVADARITFGNVIN
jgi:hypothetical protein